MMHKDLTIHQNLYFRTEICCDTNHRLSYGYSAHNAHRFNKGNRRCSHTPHEDRLILISQTVDSSYSSVCFLAVLSCSCSNTPTSLHGPGRLRDNKKEGDWWGPQQSACMSLPCSTPMGDVVVLLYNQREGQIAADYCFVLLVYSPIISLPFIIVL